MGITETQPSLCLFVSNSPVYTWTLHFYGTREVCINLPALVAITLIGAALPRLSSFQ